MKKVEEGRIIQNGDVSNCGAIKYDFTLSDEFLKADYGVPTKISEHRKKSKCHYCTK